MVLMLATKLSNQVALAMINLSIIVVSVSCRRPPVYASLLLSSHFFQILNLRYMLLVQIDLTSPIVRASLSLKVSFAQVFFLSHSLLSYALIIKC